VTAWTLTLAAWALLEVAVRVRERVHGRGGSERDRFTRVLIAVSLAGAIALALFIRERTSGLRVPTQLAGLVPMWLGLALRVWAIATLGRAFRTTIEVDRQQSVVSSGPYRWVRHPSYTGLLLIIAGFGLSTGNWLAFAVCVVVPLPAIVRRIRFEEAELIRVLGEPYRDYRLGRARLVPRLW
jgi:protein-S-isoprenylcysteine O-methyltransferase Ste14